MSNLGAGLRSVDWGHTRLEHFEKNFYVEDKRVASRSDREIEEFRRSKEIKASVVVSDIEVLLIPSFRFKVVMFQGLLPPLTKLGFLIIS